MIGGLFPGFRRFRVEGLGSFEGKEARREGAFYRDRRLVGLMPPSSSIGSSMP
jgi:hypothetical protein